MVFEVNLLNFELFCDKLPLLAAVEGAMCGGEDEILVDQGTTAPEFGAFGSVQVNGRHPGPLAGHRQVPAHHTERRRQHLAALT